MSFRDWVMKGTLNDLEGITDLEGMTDLEGLTD